MAEPKMGWAQVSLNGGPPCFALLDDEEGWYCGRAERWDGHDGEHEFVPLEQLLARGIADERARCYNICVEMAKSIRQAAADEPSCVEACAEAVEDCGATIKE